MDEEESMVSFWYIYSIVKRDQQMKKTTILKMIGFLMLGFSLLFIYLGAVVFRDRSWDDFAWKPNFAYFVPGLFLGVFSLPVIVSGFTPQITKFQAKLRKKTLDYASEDIKGATAKSAETSIPAITPSIKTALGEIRSGSNGVPNKSRKELLLEAKALLDEKLITDKEYEIMPKDILDIEEPK